MPPLPFPTIEDAATADFHYNHVNGADAHVILGLRRVTKTGAPVALADLNNLATVMDNTAQFTAEAALRSSAWVLEEITYRQGDAVPALLRVAGFALAGTRTGDTLPTQVACIVKHQSDQPGRRGAGRNFWPWGTETDLLVTGFFSVGFANSAAGFVEQLDTAFNALATPWSIAVLSHTFGTAGISTDFTADTVPDIQRRRRG